jgi:hypothetical protein
MFDTGESAAMLNRRIPVISSAVRQHLAHLVSIRAVAAVEV